MKSAKNVIYLVTAKIDKHKLLVLHNNWLLIISLIILLTFSFCSCSSDTISSDKPIRDGELLISKSKTFSLGFFTPGNSTSRYVGIWYNNLPIQTVVWVANRDSPINDTSGILSIDRNGNLVLNHNLSTIPIWSTNVSLQQYRRNGTSVIAQLTDIANLVIVLKTTKNVIWESFDYPTDTFLPYQRLGFDRKTNQSWFLQSWKTNDDPGKGAFTLTFSTIGKPQFFMYNNDLPWWRGGPWIGSILAGVPSVKRERATFNVSFVEDDNNVALTYNIFYKSVITRIVVQESGFFQTLTWDNQKNRWNQFFSEPVNQCDSYGICGSNSNCDPLNFKDFKCTCLPGFEPKFPLDWYDSGDGSGGCVRKKGASVCGNGEGFIKVSIFDKMMLQLHQDSSGKVNVAQSNIHPNLPFFSFKTIMTATRNCDHEHKLGQGGFGSVYKGCLVNGQEIAVKRLSRNSGQGKEEFKNEVTLLIKLQHRNLVRLLGCCFEKEERMLVYEYLPNKSLDFFIFDKNQRSSLDWGKRFEIICGIARGVLYLHQDSRLKIIHRDLKASNVLLDAAMDPKISDFGMARIFGDDEIQARTKRVVGT
ncbi:G-type lectin S-receptor-like serine/threonine-protein kinase RKS1 [Trifolium pratense]|uniref:G-type lectin S-receptor-like serine/threonine-protein kinase RKS1 n=1 Tax=Trifolium pratense TaxID=57577 RepID=UPI001E697468|nr:G-type lectin S-receptor-like serine/threonine-protein kinase RKS1 [Trifolium pratense]